MLSNSHNLLSDEKKERIQLVFKMYWLSPFCTGTILLGEPLLSWALEAQLLESKTYADVFDTQNRIAYQIKTGLPTSPITFARLTTSSQFDLVNSNRTSDITVLSHELLDWVRHRVQEPAIELGAIEVRIARLIYTKSGDFTYYERLSNPDLYTSEDFEANWSEKGNALELYKNGVKWFSWYPQGRQGTKNQNQLHFHGENTLIPPPSSSNRLDFRLGEPARLSFDQMATALLPIISRLD